MKSTLGRSVRDCPRCFLRWSPFTVTVALGREREQTAIPPCNTELELAGGLIFALRIDLCVLGDFGN